MNRVTRAHRQFMLRTASIFRHQKEKAAEDHQALDYDLERLRALVRLYLPRGCCYCRRRLSPRSFSLDHSIPTSRGGPHSITNLAVCCLRCNETKGTLTTLEFSAVRTLAAVWPENARINFFARLRAGGRFIRQ
jgi:5-methylcytosine-specific restriction endonuclease McrA